MAQHPTEVVHRNVVRRRCTTVDPHQASMAQRPDEAVPRDADRHP